MILKDILRNCDTKVVLEYLSKIYDESWNKNYHETTYLEIIEEIVNKNDTIKPDFVISVHYTKSTLLEDKPYWSVSGIMPDNTTYYSLDFTSWDEWANAHLFIEPASVYISKEEVLAYVLWEMTFNGFTNEEVQKRWEELCEIIREKSY